VSPPSFENARTKREKARAAGMDPNYWYAVEFDSAIPKGHVQRVTFWGTHVALYRDDNGVLKAVEDRCAHRHVPLSIGVVQGDRIVCQYHGWSYDKDGQLADIPHDMFGMKMPQCKLRTYPVKVRYGLVWIFFGDAERAESVQLPYIPDLEGPSPWACVPVDFTVKAHHSMVIDNVSDFTHEFLHRKYKPFADAKLTNLEPTEDAVYLSYDTKVGHGGVAGLFIDRVAADTDRMDLGYQYPYQWSNTGNHIKHWLFVLPIDERTTRTFYLFHFKSFKVPMMPIRFPRGLMEPIIKAANQLHIKPLLVEDAVACEAEQAGWERHWDQPVAEVNPAVHAFQNLTIKKWEKHLQREAEKAKGRSLNLKKRQEMASATSDPPADAE
jgi:phenylpropionate dioxygenase-like ring-hydroxylating dioxygenase large terminal subunit